MAPVNLMMRLCRALRWEPQEQGVKQQAASIPSVETEVIEPEGGRCNIPALEPRNKLNPDVCIAFMHRKSE